MVNLVETFTKVYGRAPKESELADLMRLHRKKEGWNESRHKQNQDVEKKARREGLKTYVQKGVVKAHRIPDYSNRPKRGEAKKRPVGNYPSKMPLIAKQMDRALRDGISVEQLAYIFDKTEPYVNELIKTWKMPVEWGHK